MADHSHHGHVDDGGVHVHVHSWKLYAGVLGALLFLTIITVLASYVDIDGFLALGEEVEGVGAWNLTVAVLIATTKAALVVVFFMHLKDDSRFNALILIGSILFIGIFFAYTMNDTSIRGTMDRYNGVRVDPDSGEAAPGGIPAPIHGEVPPPGMEAPAHEAEQAGDHAAPAEGAAGEAPAAEAPAGEAPAAEAPAAEAPAAEAPAAEGAAGEAPGAEAPAAEAPAGEAPAAEGAAAPGAQAEQPAPAEAAPEGAEAAPQAPATPAAAPEAAPAE